MKYFKSIIKGLFKKFGYRLTTINSTLNTIAKPPSAFDDQKFLLTENSSVTIFDVGAHIGQTTEMYNSLFENPNIYSFEPFQASFARLKSLVKNFSNIQIFNLGLGNISGQIDFHINKSSATNSILASHQDSAKTWAANLLDTIETIKINCTTVDEFVEKMRIDKIDILKLDTQGTEYQIIQGASKTIRQNKIKIIYLEIIIMPTYQEQKYFDEILLLLRNNSFRLYNLYNYSYTIRGELRQVDAIFIHKHF